MVNMPGFQHAVLLAHRTPSMGIGLHFNLTAGCPLSPVETIPSLASPANGRFSCVTPLWQAEDIERELREQYNKLISAGIKPTHLDTHHHIHLEVPAVYSAMMKLARQEQLPIRLHPYPNGIEELPLQTDFLIMDTYDSDQGAARLLAHLHALQEGTTELMCHPRYLEPEAGAGSVPQDTCGAELRALTDRQIKDALHEQNIALIHFGHLSEKLVLPASPAEPTPAPPEELIVSVPPRPHLPLRSTQRKKKKPRARKPITHKPKRITVKRKLRRRSLKAAAPRRRRFR